MAQETQWFMFLGFLLLSAAVLRTRLKDFAVTASLFYFLVGIAVGPLGLEIIKIDPLKHSHWLERITEVAVVVSLFTSGLKLHIKSTGHLWAMPVKLATIGMVLSVASIAALTHFAFNLPLGAAILLGAILSPTDPVLASDVQVEEVHDNDKLRFTLTGEGCLNDGTAFPFVFLGLGLLGLHQLGDSGMRWVLVDVLWASAGGIGIGYILGWLVGKLIEFIRVRHKEKIEADEFLALGLIALAYGSALLVNAYGFLAVFAAGFALRNFENRQLKTQKKDDKSQHKVKKKVPDAVLSFNEQLERILEITVVILFGALLHMSYFNDQSWIIALILVFLIRPITSWLCLSKKDLNPVQKGFVSWFGVRGVGSLYYYFYAVNHGLDTRLATTILAATYASIFVSLVMHGFSVTPLMKHYKKRWGGKQMKNKNA